MKRSGIVSLSFDDGTHDFLDLAFPVLREHGISASLSVIVGLSFPVNHKRERLEGYELLNTDEVGLLAREGVEILSHGLTHQPASNLSSGMLLEEVRDSKIRLREFGIDAKGFAVPFGDLTEPLRGAVSHHYRYMRTSEIGYNPRLDPDPYRLKVQRLVNTTRLKNIQKWVDNASAQDLWLILLLHRLSNSVSADKYSTSVDDFARLVGHVCERMEIRRIGDVLAASRSVG